MSFRSKKILSFVLLGIVCLFLALNRHSKRKYFTYQSEIWADKAGYYVYLPAAFKYGFAAQKFPGQIDELTGKGFKLNIESGKVKTKYSYGVALMELPFYFIADVTAYLGGYSRDGFSPPFHWAIDLAAVFYLIVGLWYVFNYLSKRFNYKIASIGTITLLLATHLYYYAIDEVGMSHVFSFCLFSLALFYQERYLQSQTRRFDLTWGMLMGLIVLIRPTNFIFVLLISLFKFDENWKPIMQIKHYLRVQRLFTVILGFIVIWIPQLIYWKYLSGAAVNYSYGDESFDWVHPKLAQVWLAPNNGLFLYTPFYLFLVFLLMYKVVKGHTSSLVYLIYFFLISYVFSSWWDPGFGCSFGARSFIEHLVVFVVPFSAYLSKNWQNRKITLGLTIIILLCTAFNFKMTYSFGGCFKGNQVWDWHAYLRHLLSPTK